MTDIAELEIRINVSDVERDMRRLEREMRNAENSTEDLRDETDRLEDSVSMLGGAYGRLLGVLGGLAAGLTLNAFIDTAQAVEQVEDRVKTATDTLGEARDALEELRMVAANTPLTMDELTFSFQKLVNQGIGVTGEQLQGLAALANVMGEELETAMDAIRDAVLFGGFDPLEEFGIFAEEQGDKIAVTFRGITTEIENSADSIVQHLADIGNVQFGDAFENQMDGVTGATSRLDTATGKLARQFVEAFSPAVASVIDMLADLVDAVADATREVLKFFGLIDDREIMELERDLEATTEAYWRLAEAIQNYDENAQLAGESTKGVGAPLQVMKDRATELYDEMRQLEGQIEDLQRPTNNFASSLAGVGGGGGDGEGGGGLAGAADAARMSLTGLIVSINETKEAFIAAEAASAGFTLESLEENLRSYTSTELASGGGIAFDFAGKFWDVFQNQGEFTLESLIGTFQSWGLELAQQIDFQPLFDSLSSGLAGAASQGLGAGLAGFGVGATAGGLAGGGPLGIFAGAASGAATGYLVGGPPGAGIGAIAGGLGAFLSQGGSSDNTFRFRLRGGVGGLRGDAGPDAGNFQPFVDFIQGLEDSIARTFNAEQLAQITQSLEGFESSTVRMIEGGFDAEAAMRLLKDRLTEFADTMGEGFAKLFRDIEHDTVASTEEAIQALLAVRATMDEFGISIYAARALLEDAALTGESYAETLGRLATAQATLEGALFSAEERQERQLATAKDRIDEFNDSLGLTGDAAIDTREELQAYHDELDIGTASGREAYLALLAVGDAFKLVFDAAEAAAPAVEETADVIEALEREAFDASGVIRDIVGILGDYVNWNYRLAAAINAVTQEMAGWELALNQANDTVALFQLATAAGAPLDVRMQLFEQAFAQFQQAYQQAIQQINQDLQNRITAIRDQYAELIEQERAAFDERREALQQELAITQAWASTLDSIEGIISGLQTSASPLGPSGQLALGAAGIADLQARFAAASGAERAALGQELAAALAAQLGLTQGILGVGPQSYLDEYNRTMEELTRIQEEAAEEAARQSALEQALVDLQIEQAANIDRLAKQMDAEIAAAQAHADRQLEAVNDFALGVYAEFERVGNRLYDELIQQRLEQAQQEAQNRQIQVEQLQALLVIRDGFINAGLADPTATARAQARVQRYL